MMMGKKQTMNYFSVEPDKLKEIGGEQSHIFSNGNFSMVINGGPMRGKFLREGQIYHVVEGRILIALEGKATVDIDLEEYQLEKGCVAVTAPGTIMEMKRCSEDMDVIGIVFKEEITVHDNMILKTEPAEYEELLRMAYLLWDVAHHTPFRYDTVRLLMETMISNIKYIHEERQNAVVSVPSRAQQLFQSFKALVARHCEHERSIPYYAELLHITPHHLSAVIKQASGHSVMYWINRAVILRAKVLLKTSSMMTYEVADHLNFISPSAFNNFFKRETGMTPKEFQNKKETK
jgi:AraC-like DNA-binding protein